MSKTRSDVRPLASRHVFLVKPGKRAAPLWGGRPVVWTTAWASPLQNWDSLTCTVGLVASTEMGVDIPTPKLPPSAVSPDGGFPAMLEIDLDVQVVCLTPAGAGGVATTGFLMAPRSSISKRGLRLANGVGVIDPTYRGNLRARFDVLPDFGDVAPGTSLLQVLTPDGAGAMHIVVDDAAPPSVLALFDLSSTARGAGAFGSTGAAGTTDAAGGAGGAS